jgi:hypothetical protein
MPIGAIIALVVFAGLAIWGFFIFRQKVSERGSEKSSHYESGLGNPTNHDRSD